MLAKTAAALPVAVSAWEDIARQILAFMTIGFATGSIVLSRWRSADRLIMVGSGGFPGWRQPMQKLVIRGHGAAGLAAALLLPRQARSRGCRRDHAA